MTSMNSSHKKFMTATLVALAGKIPAVRTILPLTARQRRPVTPKFPNPGAEDSRSETGRGRAAGTAGRAVLAVLVCAALLVPTIGQAANTATWNGNGTDWDTSTDWTPSANWSNSNAFQATVGSATVVTNTTLNLSVASTAITLTFGAASTQAFTVQSTGGFTLTLDSAASTGSKAPIVNNSTQSENLTCPVTITNSGAGNTNSAIENTSSGGLTFTNSLMFTGSIGSEQIWQAGSGQINVNGAFTNVSTGVELYFTGAGTGTVNFAPTSTTNLGAIGIGTDATVNFGTNLSPTSIGLGAGGSVNGNIGNTAVLYLTGNGITLSGPMTNSQATSGSLTFGSNYNGTTTNTFSGNWALGTTVATTVVYSAAGNTLAVTGTVSGGAATQVFVQTGPGTLELSGSNTYITPTSFSATNAGTIEIAGPTLTSTNGVTNGPLGGNEVFNITGGTVEDNGVAQTIANAITLGGTATFSDATPVTGTGLTFSALGTVAGSGTYGNDTFALTANSTLNVTNTTAISTKITGVGFSLTKTGAGTLAVSSASADTFNGLTVLNGNYSVTALNNAGTAGQSGSESAITLGGPAGQIGTYEDAQSSGNGSTTMGITLASGGGGGLQVDNAGTTVTLSGTISGSGSFAKSGPGSLTISGASNTFSGGLTITSGTLVDGNSNSGVLGSGNVIFGTSNTPTLKLGGNSPTVGLLAGAGANGIITNATASTTGTLTLNGAGSQSFGGVIQNGAGSGSFTALTLSGGTQTLSGNDTYTGATTANGGTLIVSGSLSGTASVGLDPSTLEVDGSINTAATISSTNSTIQGTGVVGTVKLTSTSTLAPGNTVASGFVPNAALSAGNVTFSDTASTLSIGLGFATTGTDSTQLASSGAVSLNHTPLQLTLGLDFSTSDVGTTYVILHGGVTAAGYGTGTQYLDYGGADIGAGTSFTDGIYTFQLVTGTVNGGANSVGLDLVSVPEPGTWATLLGGIGMLIVLQRKRRRGRA